MEVLRMFARSLPVFMVLAVAGCISTYHVVEYPKRDADLYPLSQSQEGISVAVDEVTRAGRADRYFGTDLTRHDILPLAVIVSNNGAHRVAVKPADVLMHEGTEVIDPLPMDVVIARAGEQGAKHFEGLTFKETVLPPGGSYEGVMFFPVPQAKKWDSRYTALPIYNPGSLQVIVSARDLDTQARYHFGPFSLSAPGEDDP
jgi:hypothetical protein